MHYLAIMLVLASDDEGLANTNWSVPRIYPEWKPMFPYFKRVWEAYHQRHERIKVPLGMFILKCMKAELTTRCFRLHLDLLM